METPSNPTWDVTDIAEAARLAHGAGAQLAVDSTAATPLLTRPIEHGADYVMHSATKYLNGHSDVIAGALVPAAEDGLWSTARDFRHLDGTVLGPSEAWLLLSGMRPMYLRVRQSCKSAMRIAEHFASHEKVDLVVYPGLPDHPGHAIAARQMSGNFWWYAFDFREGRCRSGAYRGKVGEAFHPGDLPRRRREPDRASGDR